MEYVPYSRHQYDTFFNSGYVKTPLGTVKMGNDQFNKMSRKNREHLLWAMRETLANPVVVVQETREGKDAKLYIKSFTTDKESEKTVVMSVVVKSGNEDTVISTGPRKKKQINRKLEDASSFLYLLGGTPYEKGNGTPTIGTADTGNRTQQDTLSPDSENKSTPKNDPGVYFQLTREG
ncbi:MAG: hypothetical protein LBK61_07975 [Spirochaetaceae bacterium]|jgi:hypothetical protein|nr:hypothetical protein [Spirochaetaceae bacterium]